MTEMHKYPAPFYIRSFKKKCTSFFTEGNCLFIKHVDKYFCYLLPFRCNGNVG